MINSFLLGKDLNLIQNIFNTISCNNYSNINIIKCISKVENLKIFLKSNNIDLAFIDIDTIDAKNLDCHLDNKVKIIIFSNNLDNINYIINKYKIYSVLSKDFDKTLFVNCIESIINNPIKVLLLELLNNFNFNKSSKGYKYIFNILEYCISNNIDNINNMKDFYSHFNSIYKYENNPNNIEWNIAKTLKSMISLTNEDTMKRYFTYNTYPSSKSFINAMLENIYYKI